MTVTKLGALALAVFAATALSSGAQAAFLDSPVPTNAYIVSHGLDWAWASPCDPTGGCGDIDLSYQSTQGWRLPTPHEFALRPDQSLFLFPGGNVPQGGIDPISGSMFGAGDDIPVDLGSDGACAVSYFSNNWHHCDYGDPYWDPSGGNDGFGETLAVRGKVPEPATLTLFGVGLAGMFAARRRRKQSA